MNDDGLHRLLDSAARPRLPDPDFAATLLADLGDELGFAETGRVRPVGGVARGRIGRSGPARRRPLDLLLIAVIAVGVAGGLVVGAGAIRDRLNAPAQVSLLAQLRRTGHVRIAIRPDHPQFTLGGQTATGFDADVGGELARRLGLTPDLVIEEADAMLQQRRGEAWDMALPSVPAWTIDAASFLTSVPYYRWPHLLVVAASSAAANLQDVGAGPICAVAGDAGLSWLTGSYGGTSASPVTIAAVTRPTDDECLALLASGGAVAAVTAHLSTADIAVRADVRMIGGPTPEARAAILPRQHATGLDPSELLGAIDKAIAAMRADGTLTRLSQRRFGGEDLTTP
jgi:ABC-type amino acid transport substrate-binding protein